MSKVTLVLVLFALTVLGQALTPSTFLTPTDRIRLLKIFQDAGSSSELQMLHYSVMGISLLGSTVTQAQKICDQVKKLADKKSVESLFQASGTAKNLKAVGNFDCQFAAGDAQGILDGSISDGSPCVDIYHAVAALHNLGLKIDSAKVVSALNNALKSDDSPLSHGYAFQAASLLSGDLTQIHDLIEDIVAQADEVDEKYLQFESLFTTAMVVDGAYKLATKAGKAPVISEEKLLKFANYIISRKHVQSLKNAVAVVSAIKTLSENKFHIPVAVSLVSPLAVSSKQPDVKAKVSNLFGQSLGKAKVTVGTARHEGDDAVIMTDTDLKVSKDDDSVYELNMMNVKPAHGFYQLTMNVSPAKPDARLLGMSDVGITVKVTTTVGVEGLEIGVAEKEQNSPARPTKLQHPTKASNVLEADSQQKVFVKFTLKDGLSNDLMNAHQAFIRLVNLETEQELIFVAEPDHTSTYKFELNVGDKADEFGHMNGKYQVTLIIGDAVIQNPIVWTLADVQLTFPEGPAIAEPSISTHAKKPEIKHEFRVPEKRPSALVSNVFTILVLLPLLILLIMWLKLGGNISGFPFSPSAILFHVGLAGIFVLYYLYWTRLDMFETLKYLGYIGVPTFLFGNRLLSSIAAKRK